MAVVGQELHSRSHDAQPHTDESLPFLINRDKNNFWERIQQKLLNRRLTRLRRILKDPTVTIYQGTTLPDNLQAQIIRQRREILGQRKQWDIPDEDWDPEIDAGPNTRHIVCSWTTLGGDKFISALRLIIPNTENPDPTQAGLFPVLQEGISDLSQKEEAELNRELARLNTNLRLGEDHTLKYLQTQITKLALVERLIPPEFPENGPIPRNDRTLASILTMTPLVLSLRNILQDIDPQFEHILLQTDSDFYKLLRQAFGDEAVKLTAAVAQRKKTEEAELCLTAVVNLESALEHLKSYNPNAADYAENVRPRQPTKIMEP